ncbi:hypothetical protein IMCC26256_111828 [Actinobacteria bacterium IMCC26256]|nr:hypothetical protein IMCC26256_111828 [Actinobacteria bacterium IMCC26256]
MDYADRVRTHLGLPRNVASGGSVPSPLTLRDVLAKSTPKSSVRLSSLGPLTRNSWISLAIAIICAPIHYQLARATAGETGIGRSVHRLVSIGGADLWAPWALGGVALGLVVLAIMTRGFRTANHRELVTLTALDVTACALSIPTLIVTASTLALVALFVVALCIVLVMVLS